jgi:broad specificity phosphatase PhoE
MSMTVDDLISLRSQVISGFVEGGINEEAYRADLDALTFGLDRLLTPDGRGTLQQRAAKVVAEILADSHARLLAEPPARLARIEFGSRRYRERLSREDPDRFEAERREEEALEALEPDEVRMARPIVAALRRRTSAQDRRDRLAAMVRRPQVVEPPRVPAAPDVLWTNDDRLTWDELVGGVPCHGCGQPILGGETSQRDGESWVEYRERMKPIEEELRLRHPQHGSSWTAGGGPIHCSRCCPPPPLSPEQIAQISRILNPPPPAPLPHATVRRCKVCNKPSEGGHVCQIDDLPKELRAAVEAVLVKERARSS